MQKIVPIQLGDENIKWDITNLHASPDSDAQVIVPIDSIESMTSEELIHYLRECAKIARQTIVKEMDEWRADQAKHWGGGEIKGYTYLIHGVGTQWYKIGVTRNLKSRIKAFNTQGPFTTNVVHVHETNKMYAVEKYFHELFADKRAEGEWFTLSDEDIQFFCEWNGEL